MQKIEFDRKYSSISLYGCVPLMKSRAFTSEKCNHYRPPTKLRESNVFTCVYLSTGGIGYLWCQVPSWSLVPCPFWGGGKVSLVPCSFWGGYTLTPGYSPPYPTLPDTPLLPTWDQKYPNPPTTKAGDTHHTGMLSCLIVFVKLKQPETEIS